MRYAIISDIHANATALRAVLADIRDAGADKIICLGDVVGYGPEAAEALELVHDRVHVCLAGNHDDAVCGRRTAEDFRDFAQAAVKRQRGELSASALAWLRQLPYACEYVRQGTEAAEGSFACAHGDFVDPPSFGYVASTDDAAPSFAARSEQLLFVGHTHRPAVFVQVPGDLIHEMPVADFTLEARCRYLVNAGTVGYPRVGALRSTYCLYDDETQRVTFRSLPYDLDGYLARLRMRGVEPTAWLLEAERQGASGVRAGADFARPETPSCEEMAKAAPSSETRTPQRRNLGLAIVLAAVILSLAGGWCAWYLLKGLSEATARPSVAQVAVAGADEAPRAASGTGCAQVVPLARGWQARVESITGQKVTIDRNDRKNAVAFHLVHTRLATTRLERTYDLTACPPKLYYGFERLTRKAPGAEDDFAFTLEIRFLDRSGGILAGGVTAGGKVSKHGSVVPPAGTVRARYRVECRGAGAWDVAIPRLDAQEPAKMRKVKPPAP